MMNQIDLSRVDLNLLVLFETVFEERHAGRAATRLSLTPSAISHGLRRLRSLLRDPLFVRHPKGMAPTGRAMALAAPIRELLSQARAVLAAAAPFDPATSSRRFVIGAPDAVAAVFLPPLLTAVRARAPGVALSLRQLLPLPGERSPLLAWRNAFSELDTRSLDVALVPSEEVPARFRARVVMREDFVIGLRRGHPRARKLDKASYTAADHLVVSQSGDADGFVDQVLEQQGSTRRVALTVPNFLFALSVLAESDLIAALPRSFLLQYGPRFDVIGIEPPLPLGNGSIRAVSPEAAMGDPGLVWLHDRLAEALTDRNFSGEATARRQRTRDVSRKARPPRRSSAKPRAQ